MTLFWFTLSTAVRFIAVFLLCVILYRYFHTLGTCLAEVSIQDRVAELPWCLFIALFFSPHPPRDGWIELHELVSLIVASIVTVAWAIIDRRGKNSPDAG